MTGRVIIIMGPTGSGKSVQAESLIRSNPTWRHISSGALLRQNLAEAEILATGQLVPSSDVEELVEEAMSAVPLDNTIVLDGFPRLMDEAKWLEDLLPTLKRRIELVVLIDVSREVSRERLTIRGRGDDTEAALAKKWEEYQTKTLPVIEYFDDRGLLKSVNGNRAIEDITRELAEVIDA